jgi:S1-C subfamily serine protease
MIGVGLLAAAAAACGAATTSTSTTNPPPTSTQTTAAATTSQAPSTTGAVPLAVESLVKSVVEVQMMSGGSPIAHGSGTVISEDGLILTNAHVATPSDVSIDGLTIAVTDSADAPPQPLYRAEVIAADAVLDLAVIRAVETLDGGAYPAGAIPAITVGDSDQVKIGDDLLIFGYPAIGGETITFTRGLVSGFTSDPVVGDRAWFKTDATIAGGNSGGTAANLDGELIGVPTQAAAGENLDPVDCRPVRDTNRDGFIDDDDDCVPLGGFLNGVRPVNLAAALIRAAVNGEEYAPIAGLPDPADDPNSEPVDFDPAEASFGPILFDNVTPEQRPSDDYIWLPSGQTRLCGWWEYEGMADGVRWDAIWAREGTVDEEASFIDEVWSGGESGEWWVCFTNEDTIADGFWELTLNVQGEWKAGSYLAVGDALSPVELTMTNASSDQTICYLYIAPDFMTTWGTDWLGESDTIGPGKSATYNVPVGVHDIRGDDCDHQVLFEEDAREIREPFELTFG